MNTAKKAFQGLSLGQPTAVHNLTVFPLLTVAARVPPYELLADALAKGFVTISEVSEAGSVPTLLLNNRGELPVLLLDGDHLVGCKQNRVLNVTVLAPGRAKTTIPVSCVEHGRWHSESMAFDVSNRAMYAELRAAKVEQVSESLCKRRGYDADQGAIWDGIARKSQRMGSASRSGAMDGMYRRHERDVKSYVHQFPSDPRQCGAVFAINGRIVGLEILDAPASWSKCFESVVSGYALDALDHLTDQFEAAGSGAVDAFIDRLVGSQESRFDGTGLGENVRFQAPDLTGSSLVHEEHVIHLCAFDLGLSSNGTRRRHVERRI